MGVPFSFVLRPPALLTPAALRQQLRLWPLATPGTPTVSSPDSVDSESYRYAITAYDALMETAASPVGSISDGHATLDVDHVERVTWTAVATALGYRVYRTTGGDTQGLIATITDASTLTLDDSGLTGDGSSAPQQPNEAVLEGYIAAASQFLEDTCGRTLATREVYDVALDGTGGSTLALTIPAAIAGGNTDLLAWPTLELLALTLTCEATGTEWEVDVTGASAGPVARSAAQVQLTAASGCVRLIAAHAPLACFPRGRQNILASFRCGLDRVTHAPQRALLDLACVSAYQWLFQARDRDPAITFLTVNPTGVAIQYHLSAQAAVLPPHLRNLLRPFMTHRMV